MTDATFNTLVGAIVTTITSLIGLLIVWLNLSRRQEENTNTTKETSKKADTIIEKAAEIHALTNGSLHQVTADLKVANEKILGLEKLMTALAESKVAKKR